MKEENKDLRKQQVKVAYTLIEINTILWNVVKQITEDANPAHLKKEKDDAIIKIGRLDNLKV